MARTEHQEQACGQWTRRGAWLGGPEEDGVPGVDHKADGWKRDRTPRSSHRKPSFGCRVAQVASVYAVLGVLGGGVLTVFDPLPGSPTAGIIGAAVLGALMGSLLEAVFG